MHTFFLYAYEILKSSLVMLSSFWFWGSPLCLAYA